jgi:hypothetical protein
MMPLCTTATVFVQSVCGWALRVLGAPWVAQRVWAMPVTAEGSVCPSCASSAEILPAAFSTSRAPSQMSARPAES